MFSFLAIDTDGQQIINTAFFLLLVHIIIQLNYHYQFQSMPTCEVTKHAVYNKRIHTISLFYLSMRGYSSYSQLSTHF